MNYFVSYRLLCNTVKTLRVVLCLSALLAGSQAIQAQDYDDTSTVVMQEPLEEETADTEPKITIPEPVVFRQVPDSTVRHLQKRKEFVYANDPAYWTREREIQELTRRKGFWDYFNDFFSGTAIRFVTYGILIAFFGFVIYRIIVVNKLFLFYSSSKPKTAVTGEDVDIHDENLDEKIQKAVEVKDHRLAVRYMYLKSLQLLNERQWIRFHADATNYEYVNQMSGHKLASDFGFLTRVYDYMWYGEFALTEEQFDIVFKNFSHFYNAVNS
jgi:uncharacterized protein DUF4129